LPLYRVGKIHSDEHTRVTLGSYLSKWFLYLVYYVVYCVPLAIKGLLPTELEGPIYMAWRILASFLAYRGVIQPWFDDVVFHGQQSNEGQAVKA